MEKAGVDFMELTKSKYEEDSDKDKGINAPPLELPYDFKVEIIDLKDPSELNIQDISLRDAIEGRRTLRIYGEEILTLEELTYLLWCTQGVKEIRVGKVTFRNVPSAGSRHAFESYILVNKVKGLEPGIYRYIATENKLIKVVMDEDIREKVITACHDQKFIGNAGVFFMWVAVPYRMSWKYGERSYRYLHLDAGHVCQNLYLAAESIQCGACAIGSFDDDELNSLLGLDGIEQFVIYAAAVGKNRK